MPTAGAEQAKASAQPTKSRSNKSTSSTYHSNHVQIIPKPKHITQKLE
jgi:hypothetical protein